MAPSPRAEAPSSVGLAVVSLHRPLTCRSRRSTGSADLRRRTLHRPFRRDGRGAGLQLSGQAECSGDCRGLVRSVDAGRHHGFPLARSAACLVQLARADWHAAIRAKGARGAGRARRWRGGTRISPPSIRRTVTNAPVRGDPCPVLGDSRIDRYVHLKRRPGTRQSRHRKAHHASRVKSCSNVRRLANRPRAINPKQPKEVLRHGHPNRWHQPFGFKQTRYRRPLSHLVSSFPSRRGLLDSLTRVRCRGSLNAPDLRRLPGPVDDGLIRPIGVHVEQERAGGRRKPFAFGIPARRRGASFRQAAGTMPSARRPSAGSAA